ncbi:strawberry notch-like protein [Novosphingobium kunmingense]|uniref:Strawberry notch-like protein n=1 Tax=Novosphingobium kunmingense TaxID=1211806 RepID=A0A2N0H7N6_9SPHN|nr:strawberry notch family protein [Novosphingobium kunmingense]PKB14951.1 strawberry notch-like protein [Novosphingobium kunmingense]
MTYSPLAGASVRPLASACPEQTAAAIIAAAHDLLAHLAAGRRIETPAIRTAMQSAFGASDASGAWDWKAAYEAVEVTQLLFMRRYGPAIHARTTDTFERLKLVERIARLAPTQTRRSEEMINFQQFSTPLGLAWVAGFAAGFNPGELVLEPSGGTGLLAVQAELAGCRLAVNEVAEVRAALLGSLFEGSQVSMHDAAQIHDRLDADLVPSCIVMNPPFSTALHVETRVADAAFRHLSSALARLADGGRLVAITGANCAPDHKAWRDGFVRLQESARVVFTATIAGSVFAPHGTSVETRLTVIDKVPADAPAQFPASPGMAPDLATLLRWLTGRLPPRQPIAASAIQPPSKAACLPAIRTAGPKSRPAPVQRVEPSGVPLDYDLIDWRSPSDGKLSDTLYEPYKLQSLHIPGAQTHPTRLVQSAAMSTVAPPKPSYRPHLPEGLVEQGLLSDAQLESVIYAGEAHTDHIAGKWSVDATWDKVEAAPDDCDTAVRFRKGWFLGDGTGAGKGRQVAGIVLDNWLKGRRRAVWISKSDKLLEDAQRDWKALGQEPLLVTPLARFRQGTPISLEQGILFTTYATLRSDARENRVSRVQQIVDWLGTDFDGVIVFDESHAMQNAGGGKSDRGDSTPSQQGRAGLRLQHALPDARVLYVSATGATTVENLAYAQRLGLWGGDDFPFDKRTDFVAAIEAGGVAAMEVLARDLKALGLYAARSLSYEGVEYELVEHQLTPDQVCIYDAYAGAFQVIHNNLDAALEASGVTSSEGTLNAQAKSAARSVFESAKQRFFNHLITAMKTPTLIAAIDQGLADGHAAVVQIVSTGEALLSRRLADIDPGEWNDVQVDITPREYVLDYLLHSFPTQLHQSYTDGDGNLASRPAYDDEGNVVQCREAIERRDRLIEQLASMEPVQGALDQIVQRFGTDIVAEVTGRSRRIVRKIDANGDRLAVENRPAHANLAEAEAFMEDRKQILVFSDAGGTGRSYHADLGSRNQRLRHHYLLEAGWKADAAIQGLGRTNRTNQAQPPLFRPVASNVQAEKRFLSTIARRLDTLGAITRGQRQTGGQGLFRPEDNLESPYARDALRQLYVLIYAGKVEHCSLGTFESMTGLSLTEGSGCLKDELPPITTFLNRLLALTIAMQNVLFTAFEQLLGAKVESAIACGAYDIGLETLVADSFTVTGSEPIYVHPATGAETRLLTIAMRERNQPVSLDKALDLHREPGARLLINARSKRAAVQLPARSVMLDDGEVERRIRLIRPMEKLNFALNHLAETSWEQVDERSFAAVWQAEVAQVDEFTASELHIVTGLLLPIWKQLPEESTRVYRLQTDDGTGIIGRRVSPAWAASTTAKAEAPVLSPSQALAMLREGHAVLDLADGLQLRRSRLMQVNRIELTGFGSTAVDRLKAMGLFSEIVSWKLRLFVPDDVLAGSAVIERLFERHPLARIADRKAA